MAGKKARKHSRYSLEEREKIVQAYYALGSVNAVIRKFGTCHATITKFVREFEEDPNLHKIRNRSIDELSGKIQNLATETVESIRPADLQTKRHFRYNAAGKIIGVFEEGPSVRDKAALISSMVDKIGVLQSVRTNNKSENRVALGADGGLLLPETIEACRAQIARGIKSLRILDIEFDTGPTGQELRRAAANSGVRESDISEAEVEPLGGPDPFDA